MATTSSTLYSTLCTLKNRLALLSIINIHNDENRSDSDPSTLNPPTFPATEIALESVKPATTRIRLESINENQSTTVKRTILLEHILHVQRYKFSVRHQPHRVPKAGNVIYHDEHLADTNIESRRTSTTTVETYFKGRVQSQTSIHNRQFSLSRLFTNETKPSVEDEPERLIKSYVDIRYVDVSNAARWTIQTLRLQLENEELAELLCQNLNSCLSVLTQRPRRLLVFVNPFCGKGQAKLVYEKKILPLFIEAKINVKTIYTTHANHAQAEILQLDFDEYDGLICVGGDGMFSELCHGLLLRTMRDANLDINNPNVNLIQPKLRIGIIPAGSTDAVAFGTTGSNDPVTSALQIIVGESLSIDINTVHNEDGFVRFMAAMFAYGFFGDIIRQSDKWRCLGPLRYDVSGICQFFRNKSYHTQVTMKLSPKANITTNDKGNKEEETSCCAVLGKFFEACPMRKKKTENPSSPSKSKKNRSSLRKRFCHRHCETCANPSQIPDQDLSFTTPGVCQGYYTAINCLNMPGRCAKSKFGMSPYVHLGDGSFDLILVKNSWRTGFLRFLWQVANNSLTIDDLPNVERYHVSEVCIKPLINAKDGIGNWACDGELISGREVRVRVHRQTLNLFASGIRSGHNEPYKPTTNRLSNPSHELLSSKSNETFFHE